MSKPLIGLSGSRIIDSGGMFPGYHRSYVNEDYVRSITQAGGIPIILPCYPHESMQEQVEAMVSSVQAVLLTGGHDLFPPRFGEECRQKLTEVWPERDEYDIALLLEAIRQKKPVLGICRGFQLINMYFGGKLLQDLSYADHELLKHWQGHTPTLATQEVHFTGENRFTKLYGESLWVNSFHHQVIMEVGPEMKVCGRTSDQVIEAVEHKTHDVCGVQWHPEMMSGVSVQMLALFEDFVQRC